MSAVDPEVVETLDALVAEIRREVNFPRLLRRPAPVSYGLLGAVVLLHLAVFLFAQLVGDRLPSSAPAFDLALMHGAKINALVLGGQWWRLSSAMFLHGGFIHLVFNGYAIFLLGPLLERIYGSRRFLFIYMASGLASELASVLFTEGPSVGASGALFGLLGALLVFGVKARHTVPVRVARAFSVRLLPWVVVNLAIGFIPGLPFDNAAHIGGLVTGAVLAVGLGSTLAGEVRGVRAVALEAAFLASCLAAAWGLVFMARQVALCSTSAADFLQCHPASLIGL